MPTTRQLFVLRHAKSSWHDPGLEDHERPLAPRGRTSVAMLAKHMHGAGIRPAQVLCSSARRARETVEGIAPEGELLIEPELYSATGAAILERLKQVPDELESVMVIGHNPAMQTLVLSLACENSGPTAHQGDNPDLGAVQHKFSTGALATLTFDCSWSELGPGRAALTALVRPKDLE